GGWPASLPCRGGARTRMESAGMLPIQADPALARGPALKPAWPVIHMATAPWAHAAFDLLAWSSGAAVGYGLYRWRLRGAAERIAGQVGPGYYVALAAGAIAGAWLAGSANTLQGPAPALSHSIAGTLIGAIAGVEIYKAIR